MTRLDIQSELDREPFIPFRVHLKGGKRYDIAFREVARPMSYGLLVFIGLKQGTRVAKSYDRFPYEDITKIEPRPGRRPRTPKA